MVNHINYRVKTNHSVKKMAIVALLSCAYIPAAWAQCPPGQVTVGEQSGNGEHAPICAPSGQPTPAANGSPAHGNDSAVSHGVWEDRWGALAHDHTKDIIGASEDELSRLKANTAAIEKCRANGGVNCKLIITYSDKCVAVAQKMGGGALVAKATLTSEIAKGEALKSCEKKSGAKCEIKFADCSLPVD